MQELSQEAVMAVSGANLAHIIGGGILGGSAAFILHAHPVIMMVAGTCAGAILVNDYADQIDSAFAWMKNLFVQSPSAATTL